ncbi:hypothetical protein [Psychrobacillus sp. OK032]|uniref:hypothetical protein n=1 Tax=Psychrobacillus sp. OK032 TaxID=1884358 RepID=UPI0008B08066|nr:hypothetical protein [Psychrobacillus sp. OK032]SER87675.1 hypothetical protein SAMN05518872_102451 [Psychrobacillus sp. OK032]
MTEAYTDTLRREINAIRTATKRGLDRTERLTWIKCVGDAYALAHSEYHEPARLRALEGGYEPKTPPLDAHLLDQLTNLALYEELTDTASNKATSTEYPFLSDIQLARRREGAHEAKGLTQKGEAPYTAAMNIGMDGRDYSVPKRRKRSAYEDALRDANVHSRNKERKQKYDEFTRRQPVITYKMSDL